VDEDLEIAEESVLSQQCRDPESDILPSKSYMAVKARWQARLWPRQKREWAVKVVSEGQCRTVTRS
jgi:hypothetical protein